MTGEGVSRWCVSEKIYKAAQSREGGEYRNPTSELVV